MKSIIIKCLIIALILIMAQSVFSQTAPSISYTGPQTYTVGTPITPLNVTNSGGAVAVNGQTSTFAGASPDGIVADSYGNLYVVQANSILKITPDGTSSSFAGSSTSGYADGTGTAALFNNPVQLALDAAGNLIVADNLNNRIRKITPAGVVTTVAGSGSSGAVNGTGTAASFYWPNGVAVDASGNIIVADYQNNLIRKITPAGVVTTLAGSGTLGNANGTGTAASFYGPANVAIDPSGNIFVTEPEVDDIRKITPAGVVTTLAGGSTYGYVNGTGTSALFAYPFGIVSDNLGNLYVADFDNYAVRKITPSGVVTTLAGGNGAGAVNGSGSAAEFNLINGITIDKSGALYVCDGDNDLVRKVLSVPYTISPSLPAGLSFNTTTGAITGTPTAISSATTYTVTAYNLTGSSTTTLNITVNPAPLPGPSSDQNYVITYTPRVAALTTPAAVMRASSDKTQVETNIQYIDGIGRPMQTVQVKGSPLGYDMIQPFVYDQFGRESTKYLPYTPQSGTPGNYRSTALTDQGTFYSSPPTGSGVTAITDPLAQTGFEPSPLNRPIEQGFPGVPWQLITSGISGSGHTLKNAYTLNNSALISDTANTRVVALYNVTINSDGSRVISASGYYPAGQLQVTISRNENWVSGRSGTTEEYKDKDGHVILKRTFLFDVVNSYMSIYSTYYVYDDMGQLAFVLPPATSSDASVTPSSVTLNNLCYQYRYDERGRMIQKKIPGKGWEYTVYNSIDQPVATQDSLQRANNNWIVSKYDAMGRPVLSGIWNNSGTAVSRSSLQATLSGITTNLWEAPVNTGNGYTNTAWPTTSVTATLSTDYYDNYLNIPGLPSTYTLTTGISNMTRGMATVKKTAVLNTPTDQLSDVIYYDDLGRTIKTYAQHYLGGTVDTTNYDLTSTSYNFNNQPTNSTRQHWNKASTAAPLVTIANQYIYDHMGRKLKTWEQIANGSSAPTTKTLISQTDYNEIGQVKTKHLHSTDSVNFYQNIAYTYNERGWLMTSSAPLFSMQLYYNTLTAKAYNGNIMYQYWTNAAESNFHYSYTYDAMNRLAYGNSSNGNNENTFRYNWNGDISTLKRYQANTLIDNLTYNYGSGTTGTNSLQSITDATTSDLGVVHGTSTFSYDGNGNLTVDPSKPSGTINLSYNLLNLPQNITGAKNITYFYDALGNKLRRVSVSANLNTDYIAGIQYDGTTTPSLSFIQTEEGRAIPNGSGYNYEYYLGDNLGNSRVTFDTATGSARTEQTDDYYPFGMEIVVGTIPSPKNEYLYNKKELQEELAEYDYGARFYDPVIGRWNVIDPLSEKSRRWCPYTYVEDDPIRLTDPDGMEVAEGSGCCGVFVDAFIGAMAATVDNNTGGILPVRQWAGHLVSNPSAFNAGQNIGDASSIVQSGSEVKAGAATLTASLEVTGGSGGTSIEVSGPTALVGGAMMLHGAMTGITAANSLATQKGRLPTSAKGPGSVPPSERDPKRKWSKEERAKMLDKQDGKCANCGEPKTVDETEAHHNDRHADGGKTDDKNGSVVCKDCHIKLHK